MLKRSQRWFKPFRSTEAQGRPIEQLAVPQWALLESLERRELLSVTIAADVGYLYRADGSPLPQNSTIVLLVDADNDGDFGDLTDPTTFTPGGESSVLARVPSNDIYDAGYSGYTLGDLDVTGLVAGSQLLLVWYDTPYDQNATGPGTGVDFGTYRTGNVSDFSTSAWVLPADGALETINFLTESGGSDVPNPETAGFASQNTAAGDPNTEPVLDSIGNQSVNELTPLSFTVTASDADVPAQTLTFSLDAASEALGMAIDPATGDFTWTPTEAQGPGSYDVTVTVTDDGNGNLSDSETFTVTVDEVNAAPVLGSIGNRAATEGVELAFTVTATDSDLPANNLTYSLDGASEALGMTIDPATGAFSWTPGATGSFDVTVAVTDDGTGNLSDSETFTINVSEANVAPVLDAIGNQAIDENTELAFTATASDANNPAQTLTFSLDAASLALGMTIDANTGAFSWTPTDAQGPGAYDVTVTVTDDGNGNLFDSETFTITVNDTNSPPVLGNIGDRIVDETQTLSFDAVATDGDVPADTLTYSLDAASIAQGMTIDPVTGAFSWTPGETLGGQQFSVTVTVTDNGTGSLLDSETFTVTVNDTNAAPVLAPIGDQTVTEEQQLAFTATATDSDDPADTLTYSLNAAAIALNMSIDPVTGEFTWTPTALQGPGTYQAIVTVTDSGTGNLTDEETINIVVNDTAPQPNLVGQFVNLDTSVTHGDRVTFTLAVENNGNADAAGTIRVDFYVIDPGDTINFDDLIGTGQFTGGLAAGATKNASVSVNVGSGASAGDYTVVAVIDPADTVVESDENDNTIESDPVTVVQPDYNLTVAFTSSTLAQALVAGQGGNGSVKLNITNDGVAQIGSATVRVVVVLRPVGAADDSQDIALNTPASVSVSNLAGGASRAATVSVTVPSNVAIGEYELVARVDVEEDLAETDEDDNEAVLGPNIVVADPFVDLSPAIAANIKLPTSTVSGNGTKLTVPVLVTNNGNVALASDQRVDISVSLRRVSDNQTFDVQTFEDQVVSALKPGATKKLNLKTTIPAGVPDGDYVVVVEVDAADDLAESDETNNTAETSEGSAIAVTEGFYDIEATITKSTLAPALVTGQSGQGTVTVAVENVGNINLPSTQKVDVQVYLKQQGQPDLLIGTSSNQSVANLKPAQSRNFNVQVTAPDSLAEGSYTLHAVVTPVTALAESDTDNNADDGPTLDVADPFLDLTTTVDSDTLPASILTGTTVNGKLAVTLTNNGNVAFSSTQQVDVSVKLRPAVGADIEIGSADSQSIANLKPGASKKLNINVTVPDSTPIDDYTIVVEVTPVTAFTDANPADNDATGEDVAIAAATVDLAIAAASEDLAASVASGTSGTGVIQLRNDGNVTAPLVVLMAFYAVPTGGGSEVLIGALTQLINLKAGATSPLYNVVIGALYVLASTDYSIVARVTPTQLGGAGSAEQDLGSLTVTP